jgi:hypothetical protein
VHVRRRIELDAAIPPLRIFAMTGYAVCILLAIITATEIFWQPSLATSEGFPVWGLASNFAIFVLFLGSFLELEAHR